MLCGAEAQPDAALVRGRIDKTPGDRHADPARPRQVLVGRPPGRADAAAGGRGDRSARHHAGLHQHALAGRDLVPAAAARRGPTGPASIALHHGSLDRGTREWVELGLKEGALQAVVATSSLDLGVDFLPVERVLQIGSAKGVARMLQRAGRSGHAPGRAEPHHAGADQHAWRSSKRRRRARAALRRAASRSATPPDKPLDVLVQHLVTVALGGGFTRRRAVRRSARAPGPTATSRATSSTGRSPSASAAARACRAYPEYHRIVHGRRRRLPRARSRHRAAPPALASAPSSATRRCR